MLCCTPHTGLLENYFHFLSAGRSTLIRRGDGAAFHTHKYVWEQVQHHLQRGQRWLHTGPLSPVQYWRSECCRRLEKVDDCRLLDLAHNCHQGLPFPSSRREPLSSPRDSKASNMRPLRDYDSLANWTVARRITSRSLPTDRIAIGFMSKVDRQRVFHGLASLAEVFAEYWCHVSHTQIVSVDPCNPLTANVWVSWDIRGNFNALSKGSRTFAHCGAQQWS